MEHIGRYEIRYPIGRGGFGRIFAAFDPVVGRMVAVKTLVTVLNPDLIARFRNEASTAGKLRHQNIITIYDYGEQEGLPFLVMELLDGEDLQRVIANRREISLYDKVRILWDIADGLQHAHLNGVIHRDIKPANIMLANGRQVKILDFGIALIKQATVARLTPQGNIMGTYRYMAPEQFRGDDPDSLADVFSYGVVGYELLSGVHPYDAPDSAGVMYRIVHGDATPLSQLPGECPAALDAVISRALSKDRAVRYQTLEDIKFDLEPVLLDLRKGRAEAILTEAEARFLANEVTGAQALVREALELDLGNARVRGLRDRIQHEIQRRAVRPRTAEILDAAERKLAERRYDEAIRDLESALRLDSTNSAILEKIQGARAGLELARQAERHLVESRSAFRVRNLTGALEQAEAALRADPASIAATLLRDEIRQELCQRQSARRLLEVQSIARGWLLEEKYDETINLLETERTKFPQSLELDELSRRARAGRSGIDREARLLRELESARNLVRRGQFALAAERLKELRLEFPETAEIEHLRQYSLNELEREQDAVHTAKRKDPMEARKVPAVRRHLSTSRHKLAATLATAVLGLASCAIAVRAGRARLSSPPPLATPRAAIKAPPAAPTLKASLEANLEVSAGVESAEIYLNGRNIGRTNEDGLFRAPVRPGRYRLGVRCTGYVPAPSQEFELLAGAVRRFAISLQPVPAAIASRKDEGRLADPAPAGEPQQEASPRKPATMVPLPLPPPAVVERARLDPPPAAHDSARPASENSRSNLTFQVAAGPSERIEPSRGVEPTSPAKVNAAPPAVQHSPSPEDVEAIMRVLRHYENAFQTRSVQALEEIWPQMPNDKRENLRRAFRDGHVQYIIRLVPLAPPETSGASASVECERTAQTIVNGVARPNQVTRIRVSLAQHGQGWIVTGIS